MFYQNWCIRIYKPGKSIHLWKYSIYRIKRNSGTFATEEFLSKNGTWSISSMDCAIFNSEKEVKEFSEKYNGCMFSKI